ncbi:MAG: phosphatase PAP2 family protein [Chitinophagales bacterium]
MKIKSILSIFSIFLLQISFAQSPYKLSYQADITIPTVSIGLLTTSFFLEKNRDILTIEQIERLNAQDIWAFDRGVTNNWNTTAAKASDGFLYTSIATPLLFLADKRTRQDFGKIALISTEVFMLNSGITFLTKELSKRTRPYVYNPNAPLEKKLDKGAQHSFFSGHTSTPAAMMFSSAMMYHHYFPDSKFKPLVWTIAALIPAITGYLRVRAGKHYWTDVIVGYSAGALVGVSVPLIHRK